MKLDKNLLLIIAIISIGMFVLPTTLSMFTGQHSWYDPHDRGIPCTKCHEMELYELSAVSGPHSPGYTTLLNSSADYDIGGSLGDNGSVNFWGDGTAGDRCYGCHQIGNNASGGTDFGDYNDSLHAAIRIECVDCHPWVHTELTNGSEAHRSFYLAVDDNNGTSLLYGANEACLACHTHVGVNITWNRAVYLAFNVSVNQTSGSYDVLWNSSETLGTNVTKTSNETNLW